MSKSPKITTLKQFQARFPNEDVCLDHLMRVRYGQRLVCSNCQAEGRFYRVKLRRCFECEHCGYQVYPTAGTPFEQTRYAAHKLVLCPVFFSSHVTALRQRKSSVKLASPTKRHGACAVVFFGMHMGAVDGDRPLGGSGQAAPVVEIDEAFLTEAATARDMMTRLWCLAWSSVKATFSLVKLVDATATKFCRK